MKLSKSNYLKLTCSFFNFLLSHSNSVNLENLFSLSLSLVHTGAGELGQRVVKWNSVNYVHSVRKKIIFSHFFLAMLGRENVFSSISSRFDAHNFLSRLVFPFPPPHFCHVSIFSRRLSVLCAPLSESCVLYVRKGKKLWKALLLYVSFMQAHFSWIMLIQHFVVSNTLLGTGVRLLCYLKMF